MLQVQVDDDNLNNLIEEDDEKGESPTYRIFSELPSDIPKLDGDIEVKHSSQFPGGVQITDAGGGLQTLTMTNVETSSASLTNNTATVLQYAQGADGQIFTIPAISAGGVHYQLAPAAGSSLGHSVVLATSNGNSSQSPISDEAKRKRELRLLKNREAAMECRRKKKDYIKCLENRVALLENQNKTLIEELKSLKELYCQKEAG